MLVVSLNRDAFFAGDGGDEGLTINGFQLVIGHWVVCELALHDPIGEPTDHLATNKLRGGLGWRDPFWSHRSASWRS